MNSVTAEQLARPVTQGEEAGVSPLYWLCATANYGGSGIKLLNKHINLFKQLTVEQLVAARQSSMEKGLNPLYLLCISETLEAIKLLSAHIALFKRLTKEHLVTPIAQGRHYNLSPLHFLLSSPHLAEKITLLAQHPQISEIMAIDVLMRKEPPLLYELSQFKAGVDFLTTHCLNALKELTGGDLKIKINGTPLVLAIHGSAHGKRLLQVICEQNHNLRAVVSASIPGWRKRERSHEYESTLFAKAAHVVPGLAPEAAEDTHNDESAKAQRAG